MSRTARMRLPDLVVYSGAAATAGIAQPSQPRCSAAHSRNFDAMPVVRGCFGLSIVGCNRPVGWLTLATT